MRQKHEKKREGWCNLGEGNLLPGAADEDGRP